jgi:hypothetical protein
MGFDKIDLTFMTTHDFFLFSGAKLRAEYQKNGGYL